MCSMRVCFTPHLRLPAPSACPARGCTASWKTVLVPLLLAGSWAAADAQALRANFPVTDGTINAFLLSGNTLYVGGEFTRVGPRTGSGVPLATASATPETGFPAVEGSVYAAVPDGAGGWFIGGSLAPWATARGRTWRTCAPTTASRPGPRAPMLRCGPLRGGIDPLRRR